MVTFPLFYLVQVLADNQKVALVHCKADGTGFGTMPQLTQDVLIASFVSKREYFVPILAFHVCHEHECRDRRWWAACGTLCAE
jgi:hypothetical protein